jgi:DNA polymerase III alpha subunit
MIHLRLRTEFSFRRAYGKLDTVLDKVGTVPVAGITDDGTWGHVAWEKECKARGIKPIFGVEIALVKDAELRKKQRHAYAAFLAKNNAGLKKLYELVQLSHQQFYYIPRLSYDDVDWVLNKPDMASENCVS